MIFLFTTFNNNERFLSMLRHYNVAIATRSSRNRMIPRNPKYAVFSAQNERYQACMCKYSQKAVRLPKTFLSTISFAVRFRMSHLTHSNTSSSQSVLSWIERLRLVPISEVSCRPNVQLTVIRS